MASIEQNFNSKIITAHAGGGQKDAVQIIKRYTLVSVVATALDSVKMLAFIPGNEPFEIKNNGANTLNIYPKEGEHFYGKVVNIPIPLAPGNRIVINCYAKEKGIGRYL